MDNGASSYRRFLEGDDAGMAELIRDYKDGLDEVESYSSQYVSSLGGTPYSAGPGKIYIDNEDTGERDFYDLTVDEVTGRATATVHMLMEYGRFLDRTTELLIPHYDPETPYGEPFEKDINEINMSCLSGFTDAWIHEETNSYGEMCYFDVVIDQDTPDGVYYIAFDNHSESLCQDNFMLGNAGVIPTNVYSTRENGEVVHHNDPAYWLKIVVGDSSEASETAETTGDVDLDGEVTLDDAAETLRIYAEAAAGINGGVQILQSTSANADVNSDGSIDLDDAVSILTYYARKAAGLSAEW